MATFIGSLSNSTRTKPTLYVVFIDSEHEGWNLAFSFGLTAPGATCVSSSRMSILWIHRFFNCCSSREMSALPGVTKDMRLIFPFHDYAWQLREEIDSYPKFCKFKFFFTPGLLRLSLYWTIHKVPAKFDQNYCSGELRIFIREFQWPRSDERMTPSHPAIIHVGLLSITSLILTFETFKREQPLPISWTNIMEPKRAQIAFTAPMILPLGGTSPLNWANKNSLNSSFASAMFSSRMRRKGANEMFWEGVFSSANSA